MKMNAFECKVKDHLTLIALGDVHYGCRSCEVDIFKSHINDIRRAKDTAVILMGDLCDIGTRDSVGAGTYDDKINPEEQYEEMLEILTPVKDKIIGLHTGNHEERIRNKTSFDISKMLSRELSVPYLHHGALHKIRVNDINFHIYSIHGSSCATTVAGKINACIKMQEKVSADIYCFSNDTELLTTNGWKKQQDVIVGEEIFSLNIKTNKIEKDTVLKKINYFSHDIFELDNSNISMALTKYHRVLYKWDRGFLFNPVHVLQDYSGQIKIPVAGEYVTNDFQIKDDELRLVGWLISEGHFRTDQQLIQIYQKDFTEKTEEIESILKRLDLKYKKHSRLADKTQMATFNIFSESAREIRKIINKKRLPKWTNNLSTRQFEILMDAMIKGDGHYQSSTAFQYYSKDEILIDQLQALCTIHNLRAKKVVRRGGFTNGITYSLNICRRNTTSVPLTRINFKRRAYDGQTWCVTTNNSTVIVRRNGTIFISGNCMAHSHGLDYFPQIYYSIDNRGGHIVKNTKHFILTGSFVDWDNSYAEMKNLSPSPVGVPKIRLYGHLSRGAKKVEVKFTDR